MRFECNLLLYGYETWGFSLFFTFKLSPQEISSFLEYLAFAHSYSSFQLNMAIAVVRYARLVVDVLDLFSFCIIDDSSRSFWLVMSSNIALGICNAVSTNGETSNTNDRHQTQTVRHQTQTVRHQIDRHFWSFNSCLTERENILDLLAKEWK